MDRIYHWKNFVENSFAEVEESINTISKYSIPTNFDQEFTIYPLCSFFIKSYDSFHIPNTIEEKLNELLEKFDTTELNPELLILGCALQHSYSENYEIVNEDDELLKEFDESKKEFKKLLKVLNNYLNSNDYKDLPNITFRPLIGEAKQIKNSFVKWDIYDAICNGFDLNKRNFEARSKELLAMNNQVQVKKYCEKVKVDFINGLYNYIDIKAELKRADKLRFVGVFLKLFQVKINNSSDDEFELYESLEDNESIQNFVFLKNNFQIHGC